MVGMRCGQAAGSGYACAVAGERADGQVGLCQPTGGQTNCSQLVAGGVRSKKVRADNADPRHVQQVQFRPTDRPTTIGGGGTARAF